LVFIEKNRDEIDPNLNYGNANININNNGNIDLEKDQIMINKDNLTLRKTQQKSMEGTQSGGIMPIVEVPLLASGKVPIIHEVTTIDENFHTTFDLNQSKNSTRLNNSLLNPKKQDEFINLPPKYPPYKPQVTLRKKLFSYERSADIEPNNKKPAFSVRNSIQHNSDAEIVESLKNMNSASSNSKNFGLNGLDQWVRSIINVPAEFTLNAPVLSSFKDGYFY